MDTLTLFGQPRLELAGNQIDITSKKGFALIAYLVTQPTHTANRETIGSLLWPEFDDGRARANLRNLLYGLNKESFQNWLQSDAAYIRLNVDNQTIDVVQFMHGLAHDDLETAVSHYTGPFLDGFLLPDSEPFMEWQREQQARFQRQANTALHTLAERAIANENWARAEQYSRRQIALDNLQEPAWQQLMIALNGNGRRAEALTVYDELAQLLESELGIEPTPEITNLAEHMRNTETTVILSPDHQATQTREKAKQILLDKVSQFWVEGVLKQSLHGAALIELGIETRPDVLDYPWGMVLQRPSHPPEQLPANTSLYHIFQANGRALLILGQPGSGKTTMLLDLTQQAIARAQEDANEPVPVVFNLSSWAQSERPLKAWLTEELNAKYLIPPNISQGWLNQDALLLLLDGLDEVRPDKQAACIQAINQFRQAHGLAQIVVCSRTAEYEAQQTKLRLETAVQLQPLALDQITAYLQAGGEQLTAVLTTLKQDNTLQEMASSPLMLSIIALAYRNLAPEDLAAVLSPAAKQQHLFDTYVTQMAQRKGETYSYSLEETRNWLSYLAKKLTEQKQTIFLLDMLQPGWLDGRGLWLYSMITRIIGGLLIGLLISIDDVPMIGYSLIISLLVALFTGYKFQNQRRDPAERPYRLPIGKTLIPILFTLAFIFIILSRQTNLEATEIVMIFMFASLLWLPFGLLLELRDSKRTVWNDIQTVEILTWSWPRARRTTLRGILVGTIGGTLVGLLLAFTTTRQIGINLFNTVWPMVALFGLPMGLAVGLLTGFSRDVIPMKTRPDQGFRLTLRLILSGAFIGALSVGVVFSLLAAIFMPQSMVSLTQVLSGFLFGTSLGLRFGLLVGLWYGGLDLIYYLTLHLILHLQHKLPLRLISFLDEASRHLYLRKVGGGYIFAHKLLQDYFADDKLKTETAVSTPVSD